MLTILISSQQINKLPTNIVYENNKRVHPLVILENVKNQLYPCNCNNRDPSKFYSV